MLFFLYSASAVSGFLASFFSLPFDNAKTKMQKMKKGPDGKFEYANIFDAIMKVFITNTFNYFFAAFAKIH